MIEARYTACMKSRTSGLLRLPAPYLAESNGQTVYFPVWLLAIQHLIYAAHSFNRKPQKGRLVMSFGRCSNSNLNSNSPAKRRGIFGGIFWSAASQSIDKIDILE
jgi:hypothetical protein